MDGLIFRILIDNEMAKLAFGPAQARAASRIFRNRRVAKVNEGHFSLPSGNFVGPRRGDALTDLRGRTDRVDKEFSNYLFGDKNWTPEERTVFDGLIKGVHERAEAKALRGPAGRAMDRFGHESALPVLYEHNAARAARSAGYERPAETVRKLRLGEEEDVIRSVLPDYQHGVSRRLNRSEIKNVVKILENRAIPWWRRTLLREKWDG